MASLCPVRIPLASHGESGFTCQAPSTSLGASNGGYRLCSARPGRYRRVLRHESGVTTTARPAQWVWPVQTDITVI